jgi:hypothetical protein
MELPKLVFDDVIQPTPKKLKKPRKTKTKKPVEEVKPKKVVKKTKKVVKVPPRPRMLKSDHTCRMNYINQRLMKCKAEDKDRYNQYLKKLNNAEIVVDC